MENRIGMFYVSSIYIYDEKFIDVLCLLRFIPCEVYYSHRHVSYRFVGRSPNFKEIKEGDQIPVYDIEINKNKDKITKVEAKMR